MFTDTHTHLYDEAFKGEEDLAVERSVEAGVNRLIFPDIDSTSREAMFSLARKHPGIISTCLGLHPTSVNADWKKEYSLMEEWPDRDIVAIGEIGMDCYWSREFVDQQQEVFELQLELAHKLDLPVIIHSREATGLILDSIRKHRHSDSRGVFHAFSGSIETYREIQKLGDWYIGIGGVLTYKKASISETVRDIPLERIVLETDSPYLTPVPYRGKRNESSFIPFIAGKLAQIQGRSLEEVAETTTSNASTLFKIQ